MASLPMFDVIDGNDRNRRPASRDAAPARGTYICGHHCDCGEPRNGRGLAEDSHCWAEHTAERLLWLYGAEGAAQRVEAMKDDVAAWRALGTRRAA